MSFTEDELQAFTAILERRFVVHRQEMEQALDQRFSHIRFTLDQQLFAMQQRLSEQSKLFRVELAERLQEQLDQFAQAINQGAEQRQQSTSERVERLQEQLLQIAQIVNQEARQRQQFDTDLMLRLQEQQQ